MNTKDAKTKILLRSVFSHVFHPFSGEAQGQYHRNSINKIWSWLTHPNIHMKVIHQSRSFLTKPLLMGMTGGEVGDEECVSVWVYTTTTTTNTTLSQPWGHTPHHHTHTSWELFNHTIFLHVTDFICFCLLWIVYTELLFLVTEDWESTLLVEEFL